jgi:hypothetical protein
MASEPIQTVVQMMESLLKPAQNQVVDHLELSIEAPSASGPVI